MKNNALLGNGCLKFVSKWGVTNYCTNKIYWLKGIVPGHLGTSLLSFFGRSSGEYFFRFDSFIMKDVPVIRFWQDKWLGNTILWKQYLALYNIVRCDATCWNYPPPNMALIRDPIGTKLATWNSLSGRLATVKVSQEIVEFQRYLLDNGNFSVDCVESWYNHRSQ